MKKFEILQESPKCDRDTNWANAVGKMVLIHFLEAGLPWMLNLFKKKKKKEKHYLWGTIKPGMSVFLAVPIYKSTQIRTRVRTVSMRMYVSTLSVLLKLPVQTGTNSWQMDKILRYTTGCSQQQDCELQTREESKKKATQRKPGFAYFYHSVIKTIVSSLSQVINVFYQLPMQSVTIMNKFAFLTKRHLETK